MSVLPFISHISDKETIRAASQPQRYKQNELVMPLQSKSGQTWHKNATCKGQIYEFIHDFESKYFMVCM